ncbi:MAG TPA: hypothetical protein VFU22_17070, partial [Roseiflexaceae bacterium]|nr:hypothetical protein [Roseiflexaceae bacterium]
ASCCVYPVRGETTAANNATKYTTAADGCQMAVGGSFRGCAELGENQNIVRNAGEYTTLPRTCQENFKSSLYD